MQSNDIELKEVAYDALREMYGEAEPPLNFDDVLENPDAYSDEWYKNHVLPSDRQREIVEKHCDKHDLTDRERTAVHMTAILDLGPTAVDTDDE